MTTTLEVLAHDVRTASPTMLAWCHVHNRAAGRDDVFVRWLDDGITREARLAYWLSFDDVEKLHTVKFVLAPALVTMDQEIRDLLTADVLAWNKSESTDWMHASRAQVEAAVHS